MAYIRTGEDNGAKKRPGSANSHLGQAELVVYTDAQNQVPHLGGVASHGSSPAMVAQDTSSRTKTTPLQQGQGEPLWRM